MGSLIRGFSLRLVSEVVLEIHFVEISLERKFMCSIFEKNRKAYEQQMILHLACAKSDSLKRQDFVRWFQHYSDKICREHAFFNQPKAATEKFLIEFLKLCSL